jgi:hypothetical protein
MAEIPEASKSRGYPFDRIAAREAGVEPPPEALKPWPEVTVLGPRISERPGGET